MNNNRSLSIIREFIRNRGILLINVLGLTLGITFCLFIGIYVKQELSMDQAFPDKKQIFRLEIQFPERGRRAVQTSALGPDLKESVAGIQHVLRVQFWDQFLVKNEENYFTIPRLCLADSTFFDFFEQSWLYGNPKEALTDPFSMVLTEELAFAVFGKTNPTGLTLRSQSGKSIFTVKGVIKKRKDSHIEYDALLSMTTLGEYNPSILHTYDTQQWLTYLKLDKSSVPSLMEEQIFGKMVELVPDLRRDETNRDFFIVLNPLTKIYFTRNVVDFSYHGNHNQVLLFIAIACLILLLACINFNNLNMAHAFSKAKEVGIRKIAGAQRKTILIRFLSKSLSVSFLSTMLGVSLAILLLPAYNQIIGRQLQITFFDNPYTISLLLGIVLITGLFSGLYPAWFVSSFDTIHAIKGKILKGNRSWMTRKGLILFQFFISVVLISGSILIYRQLAFTSEKDMGFNTEDILTIRLPGQLKKNQTSFKERLLQHPEIHSVSYSYTIPGSDLNYEGFTIRGKEVNPLVISVDPDYLNTYGIPLVAGRNFDQYQGSDSIYHCIINETMAKEIGMPDPLNEWLSHEDAAYSVFQEKRISIIGIVKDFHFKSLRSGMEPIMLGWNPDRFNYINIKIADGKTGAAMNAIQKLLDEFVPGIPVEFQFIEESFDNMYRSDHRMGKILICFTLLSVFIGILGLFGIVVFLTQQRTKEIAIRKTQGACVREILVRITLEYAWPVILANALAWPVVIWLGSKWLSDFVYRTSIGIDIFLYSAFITLLMAMGTVLSVTLKDAFTNPAHALQE
ncbi:MAG: ABC transporter permease [Alphaproteobacteria bacterium]|nr:ABC transporter permease [Alphaproteobacteria bacterium]